MKETIMYCHERETTRYNKSFGAYWYNDFTHSEWATQLYDDKEKPIKVRVRELKDEEQSHYYAWWSNEENQFIFVHPTRNILEMCFPYGLEAEIERNKGKDYNVFIEILSK